MHPRPLDRELTDGVVTLRSPSPGDSRMLIAGRDAEFHRFMGEGSPSPEPTAVVLDITRRVVGWVDYDIDHEWLGDGEVNLGYNIFPDARRRGFARRAVELLMVFLAGQDELAVATLLIDPANASSIGVAERTSFVHHGDVGGQLLFKRPIRPAEASGAGITGRSPEADR